MHYIFIQFLWYQTIERHSYPFTLYVDTHIPEGPLIQNNNNQELTFWDFLQPSILYLQPFSFQISFLLIWCYELHSNVMFSFHLWVKETLKMSNNHSTFSVSLVLISLRWSCQVILKFIYYILSKYSDWGKGMVISIACHKLVDVKVVGQLAFTNSRNIRKRLLN